MTTNNKKNWAEISSVTISQQAVRDFHVPAENFKLYSNQYAGGELFAIKAGHEFILYIISGACKTRVEGQELRLSSGEFIEMAANSYAFEVLGVEPLEILKVFKSAKNT